MNSSVPHAGSADFDLTALSQAAVLITAANRRVRERCARLIHDSGSRPNGPFGVVRCAGSGHRSSRVRRVRALDAALAGSSGGTLFVDDVGEMGPAEQQRLLAATASCQVRIIAGSSRSLLPDITAGRFDADLYYRLNVLHLTPAHSGG